MATDTLDAVFSALADPTRRAIIARLALGEASVKALAEPFHMSLPAVSRHLKVLEHGGLIVRRRTAQRRPCRLNARGMKEAMDWLENYRRFQGAGIDRLDGSLGESQPKPKLYEPGPRPSH